MAISFVDAGTEGSAASGNITPGLPSGLVNDDLLICICHSSDQVAHSMTGDWTEIVQANGGGTTSRLSVWRHKYAGSNPSATITHTAGATIVAGIAAFRGVDPTTPIDVAGSISGGTDASMEHAGVTINNDYAWLLLCNGAADDNNRTRVTGYGPLWDDSSSPLGLCFKSTAGNPDGSVSVFARPMKAGATGSITVTQAASDAWASVQIALKPASSTGIKQIHTLNITGDTTVTFSKVPQEGSAIVVCVGGWASTGFDITNITDSEGNTFSVAVELDAGDPVYYQESIRYQLNLSSVSDPYSLTIDCAVATNEVIATIYEVEDIAATDALDRTGSNSGSSTAPSATLSAATTQADEYVFGIAGLTNASAAQLWTAPSGFTPAYQWPNASTFSCQHIAWKELSATEQTTATWGVGTTGDWYAVLASFKKAFAGDQLTATNLTVASPSLGAPDFDQPHKVLSASGLATGSPVIDTATLGQGHALAPVGLTVSALEFGSPSVSLIVALAADALTTSVPVLDAATLDQQHVLGATELTTSALGIDVAVLAQEHVFAAEAFAAEALQIDTATLMQGHALSGIALTVESPVFDTPAVTENAGEDVLSPSSMAVEAPEFGAVTLVQAHGLAADALTNGAPQIDTATLVQQHAFVADALVVGSPQIDAPDIGQGHALAADALTVGSPQFGTPAVGIEGEQDALTALGFDNPQPFVDVRPTAQLTAIGGEDHLTANALPVGAPDFGGTVFVVVNHLVADALTVGSPELPTASAVQQHGLAAAGITVGGPALPLPPLGLTPLGLTTTSPSFETPSLVQAHGLAASALVVGPPDLPAAALGQGHGLAATALTAGQPVLGTPSLGQTHALTALSLSTGSPELPLVQYAEAGQMVALWLVVAGPQLGTPALGQSHGLAATALVVESPVLPTINVGYVLPAAGLTTASPVLAVPALGQVHALTASALTVTGPVLGLPSMSGAAEMVALDLSTGAPILPTPALVQRHVLTAAALTIAGPVLDAPGLSQSNALLADGLSVASPGLATPALTQRQAFVGVGIDTGAPQIGDAALGQHHVLSPTGLVIGAVVLAAPVMVSPVLIVPDLVVASPNLGAPIIGQEHRPIIDTFAVSALDLGRPVLVERETLGQADLVLPIAVIGARTIPLTVWPNDQTAVSTIGQMTGPALTVRPADITLPPATIR